MAISLSNDDISNTGDIRENKKVTGGTPTIQRAPMKPTHRMFSEKHRRNQEEIIDFNDPPVDVISPPTCYEPRIRNSSLNRRQARATSKERGGTQLPTWAETRTTRLRRSRALGENKPTAKTFGPRPHQQSNKKNDAESKRVKNVKPQDNQVNQNNNSTNNNLDAEDEADEDDNGHFLMERIRANSRNLRARISSHTRHQVADTGAGNSRRRITEDHENSISAVKQKDSYNGVYTRHTRRNVMNKGGPKKAPNIEAETNNKVEIENTTIKLVDEDGKDIDIDHLVEHQQQDLSNSEENNPEILHLHTLSASGEDSRENEENNLDRIQNSDGEEKILNDTDEQQVTEEETGNFPGENDQEVNEGDQANESENNPPNDDEATNENELRTFDDPDEQNLENANQEYVNDLQEGHLINHDGQLTIEVEVKELNENSTSPPVVTVDSVYASDNLTPAVDIDDSIRYDSYRVYSEQNLPYEASSPPPVTENRPSGRRYSRSHSRTRRSSVNIRSIEKEIRPRGVYLRRMEHRDRSSSMRRVRSDGSGLDKVETEAVEQPSANVTRGTQIRRGGLGSVEKWRTTSSTGDLSEAAWNHVGEKERLLAILDSVRAETRVREKQREDLLKRIKQLQSKAHRKREQGEDTDPSERCLRSLPKFAARVDSAEVREAWRKRYLEAKKVTPRLEEECSRLRNELEKLHRELLAKVQAGVWALLTISGKTEKPSNKLSYKIMIARLLQEIEDLSRRVEATRLKLHTEMRLRAMAEKDVRNLREELLKKKIQVTLTRNQEQAAMGNSIREQYFISAV